MIINFLKRIIFFYLKDIGIKYKLLLSYFILIIVPLLVLTLLSFSRSSKIIQDNMSAMMVQSMNQLSQSMNTTFEKAVKASEIILSNHVLQDTLAKNEGDYNLYDQWKDAAIITDMFKSFQNEEDIFRIRIYMKDELAFSKEHINFFGIQDIADTELYKKYIANIQGTSWIPPQKVQYTDAGEKAVISLTRAVFNFKFFGKLQGVLCVDLLEKNIVETLESCNIANTGLVSIVDENGDIIVSSNQELLKEKYSDLHKYLKFQNAGGGLQKASINNQQVMIGSRDIKASNWRIVAVAPSEQLLSPVIKLRNYTLILMLLLAVAAYSLSYFISLSITKRVSGLNKTMKKVKQGDLTAAVLVDGKDEIGELQGNFNSMLEKVLVLMEEKYRLGQGLKSAELKALQAQINPHFLYNTLDLIRWRAIKYKAQDISVLVDTLSKFYKLSLSKGKDIVTLADELAHVEAYVQIQNQRFKNRIQLNIAVEEELAEYNVLKLILQPIVENSILHGIMEKEEQRGTIDISARKEGEALIIRVMDDGVGMEEETLNNILSCNSPDSVHGYGIGNIHQRIGLFYGNQYGLTYTSKRGEWTVVEVRIAARKNL